MEVFRTNVCQFRKTRKLSHFCYLETEPRLRNFDCGGKSMGALPSGGGRTMGTPSLSNLNFVTWNVSCWCWWSAARNRAGHNQAIDFSRRLSWIVTTISIRFLVTLASVLVTMTIHVCFDVSSAAQLEDVSLQFFFHIQLGRRPPDALCRLLTLWWPLTTRRLYVGSHLDPVLGDREAGPAAGGPRLGVVPEDRGVGAAAGDPRLGRKICPVKTSTGIYLTRARPGVWATFARPGGGGGWPPPPDNSKTKKDSDKRWTALDRPWQVLQKILRSFFDQVKFEVTEGQKRSNFLKIGLFSQKIAIISITILASRIVKQPNDSPRYPLSIYALRLAVSLIL